MGYGNYYGGHGFGGLPAIILVLFLVKALPFIKALSMIAAIVLWIVGIVIYVKRHSNS